MKPEPSYYQGDVVILPKGSKVLLNRESVWVTEQDYKVVVEAARKTTVGLRLDHFEDGEVVDCRRLNDDGTYNPQAPLYSVALAGDFAPGYLVQLGQVIAKLKKTYLPAD